MSPTRHPRHTSRKVPGAVGLAARQLRADPWTSVLLALLVAITSCVATAGPRVLADLNSRQLDYTLNDLSVLQRDIRTTQTIEFAFFGDFDGTQITFDEPSDTWSPMREGLDRLRAEQPDPLRSIMQPGKFYVDVDQPVTGPNDPASDIAEYTVQFRVDPLLEELATLTEGDWPAAAVPVPTELTDPDAEPIDPEDLPALEVVVNQQTADRLVWAVGEERGIGQQQVRLTGTYTVDDPEAAHWAQSPFGADFGTFFDGDRGTLGTATAYLAPANPGVVVPGSSREVHAWFTLDASQVASDDVQALTSQIGGLTAGPVIVIDPALSDPDGAVVDFRPRLTTEIFNTLADVTSEQSATASIMAVSSAGPIGVTLAVFALGATLIVHRRRTALAVARARGGSARQLGVALAAESAALGLPAAALGYAVAGLLITPSPSASPWPQIAVAAVIGLIPAVIIAVSVGVRSRSAQGLVGRSDLGGAGGGRGVGRGGGRGVGVKPARRAQGRFLAEVIVVGLAVVATWQLFDRGLTGTNGPDPLLAATPLLLALAAAIITLRLYPLPLRLLAARLHTRASLTPFLGAARALRDPAGGLVPALAMILGVAVMTFSTVLSSTITDGAERAAWNGTGAQIRLSGPTITDDLVETLTALPGVADVAVVSEQSRTVDVIGDEIDGGVSLFVVSDTLASVQGAAPLVTSLPPSVYADATDLPLVTGGDVDQAGGTVSVSGVGQVRVVGHVDQLPGVSTGRSFVVVRQSAWEAAGRPVPSANLGLISVVEDADREDVAATIADAVPNSLVETPDERLDAFTAAPATSGLSTVFVVVVALTTTLTVLAILLVQALGSASRMRLLALLRTMGARRRDHRAIATWEVAPVLIASGLAGAAVGALVPWVLLRAVDLRGLTGSPLQPELALDPWLLGLVAAGVLLVVVLAVIASATLASRADLAQHLRLGEER